MGDNAGILTCSSFVSDDDPIIFVCNGEVNTSCLDDLHEDSCLKKGALHTFLFKEQQQHSNSSSQCHEGDRYFGFLEEKGNQVGNSDGSDVEVNMDLGGNGANRHLTEEEGINSSFGRIFYGFRFPVDTALTEHGENLFMMTSQWINSVIVNAERHICTLLRKLNPLERKELLRQRKQIKTFLNFVNQQVVIDNANIHYEVPNICHARYNNPWNSSVQENGEKYAIFLKDLLVNVQSLLLDVGLLSDLPKHCVQNGVSRLGNNSTSRHYHIFHLHLDIYWSVLEFVFLVLDIYPKFDVSSSSSELVRGLQWLSPTLTCLRQPVDQIDQDFFQSLVELYVRDLTTVAWQRFSRLVPNDFNKVSPFPCTCVKEMWTMLIQILRCRQRNKGGRSFWFTLHQVFLFFDLAELF